MIIRLVLLLALVLGLLWWFGKGRRRVSDRPLDVASPPAPPVVDPGADLPTMVRCAHCGVHLPRAEALGDAHGQLFCGEAHRQLGPARDGQA
jgi:uncharacterized protein